MKNCQLGAPKESNQRDIQYTKLTEALLPGLFNSVQRCFPAPNGEVMANHLEIFPIDYYSYSEFVCSKALKDKLSYLACDRATQEVVGFLIAEPLATAPAYSQFKISPKFEPLIAILEYLDAEYLELRSGRVEDTLHLYMLGVNDNFRGTGIGQSLVQAMIEEAQKLGYRRIIAEATGFGSQKILRELGFSLSLQVAYADFSWQGHRSFTSMPGPTHCQLVEKDL